MVVLLELCHRFLWYQRQTLSYSFQCKLAAYSGASKVFGNLKKKGKVEQSKEQKIERDILAMEQVSVVSLGWYRGTNCTRWHHQGGETKMSAYLNKIVQYFKSQPSLCFSTTHDQERSATKAKNSGQAMDYFSCHAWPLLTLKGSCAQQSGARAEIPMFKIALGDIILSDTTCISGLELTSSQSQWFKEFSWDLLLFTDFFRAYRVHNWQCNPNPGLE